MSFFLTNKSYGRKYLLLTSSAISNIKIQQINNNHKQNEKANERENHLGKKGESLRITFSMYFLSPLSTLKKKAISGEGVRLFVSP
ncbi:hypothetical protein IGI04_007959 [Brassica rapa subsp. trilocularis]|uniref:Uncharacterized protein n=1 Tax=Brassica rapa subsp. trilocularis TaxID=1813537 RepID=A0ABQ7NNL3_BRACM|nr:hypothetical protein IGI04_007959 [Brassica rapa subsp. trilocularis]